jgi:nitroreductase
MYVNTSAALRASIKSARPPSRGTGQMNTDIQQFMWQPDARSFDGFAPLEQQLRFALQYAVLAPSNHNAQPWRFLVNGAAVQICADRTRALPVVDPFDRELLISCGAALFNLRVALSHFGLAYSITLFPSEADPDIVANLSVSRGGHHDVELARLFDAITARVTTRAPFVDEVISGALQMELVAACDAEGAIASCVEAYAAREAIAALIEQADHVQFADVRFRRELASWIHPRRRGDGMPAYGTVLGELLDLAAPAVTSVVRVFDLGAGAPPTHQRLVSGSPLLVGISTAQDNRESWLAAGQALERLLLVATRAGLSASYLNQPIEVGAMRESLQTLLQVDAVPQLLLRVGRGPRVDHAPRRPMSECVS